MAQIARKKGKDFDCADWLHKANELPLRDFKQEVERCLTGQDTEPRELIYFKVFKSQILVIEQALETASMMLGSDKSRGYMLEMICTDFLAGANVEGDPEALLLSLNRIFCLLPDPQKQEFLDEFQVAISATHRQTPPAAT